jgi:hypothetical protein
VNRTPTHCSPDLLVPARRSGSFGRVDGQNFVYPDSTLAEALVLMNALGTDGRQCICATQKKDVLLSVFHRSGGEESSFT